MARTLYHLHFISTGLDYFYGSIKAITDHNSHSSLGVGRDTLYRINWLKGYENDKIKISKSELLTTADVRLQNAKNKRR